MPRRAVNDNEDAPPSDESLAWKKLLDFIAGEGATPQEAYRRMRERLIKFHTWRGNSNVEELADETLSRVAEKLVRGDIQAERPAAFIIGVARMIDLEWKRREGRWVKYDDGVAGGEAPSPTEDQEQLLAALEACLDTLSAEDRRLLLRYHEGRGERRISVRQAIASELDIAINALRVRMHRMRMRVESCVQRRLEVAAGSAAS